MSATPTTSPPQLDIFELASLNGENIRSRYDAARDSAGASVELLDRFCARVEREGRMSINTRSKRLLAMLRSSSFPNPYEEARERARSEGGDSEKYLQEQQNSWYRKRVTFDRSFVGGESIRYASLNIGGGGLSYYGLYCLILREPSVGDLVALLPDNSLKLCMDEREALDEVTLRRELAPWHHRHHLAACKHARDVVNVLEASWPVMMCCTIVTPEGWQDSFIEILLGAPVKLQAVVEIRIAQDRLAELTFKLLSDTLTDPEKTELDNRIVVFEELKKHGLDGLCQQV